jgi:hypothetical protein
MEYIIRVLGNDEKSAGSQLFRFGAIAVMVVANSDCLNKIAKVKAIDMADSRIASAEK